MINNKTLRRDGCGLAQPAPGRRKVKDGTEQSSGGIQNIQRGIKKRQSKGVETKGTEDITHWLSRVRI